MVRRLKKTQRGLVLRKLLLLEFLKFELAQVSMVDVRCSQAKTKRWYARELKIIYIFNNREKISTNSQQSFQ